MASVAIGEGAGRLGRLGWVCAWAGNSDWACAPDAAQRRCCKRGRGSREQRPPSRLTSKWAAAACLSPRRSSVTWLVAIGGGRSLPRLPKDESDKDEQLLNTEHGRIVVFVVLSVRIRGSHAMSGAAVRFPPAGLLGPEFLQNVAPGRGLMSLMKKIAALVAGAVIVAAAQGAAFAQGASPDDVAKFLAGMPPSAGSPIAALTRNPGWQRHSKWFESNWDHAREAAALQGARLVGAKSEGPAEHAVLHVQRSGFSLRQRLLSSGQYLSDERPRAGRRDSQRQRAHDRCVAPDSAIDRHVAAAELLHHAAHAQPA